MRKIQILGTGCVKCEKLFANAEEAAGKCGSGCELEKVSDIERILDFGIMMTPALVIDGEVKAVGKVLSPGEILAMLENEEEGNNS
jgi:small redox-active disulfide protein 2